ncbi:MAG TPA: hypothetical protein VJ739_00235 [Gemmataceae bacterium]|nr:hypothetical protein [Gemmataceae bacterium]
MSTADHPLSRPEWQRLQGQALVAAAAGFAVFVVVGVILYFVGGISAPGQFFLSYLVAYLFWLGAALGSMALLMLQHLTGGAWGLVIRRVLESATRTLPLLVLLFLPIVFALFLPRLFHGGGAAWPDWLYSWTDADFVKHDEDLVAKGWYLNIPRFLICAGAYFAIWIVLSFILDRWSVEQDERPTPGLPRRMRLLAGPGLVLYGLTITFASVDWVMSLQPHWYSTMFPPLFATGEVLTGMALAVTMFLLLATHPPLSEVIRPDILRDLGNLLLAFVMLWAYMSFSQFLLVWVGNLPEETPWYLYRGYGDGALPWAVIAVVLLVVHFAVPFLLLLSRNVKEQPRRLVLIAAGLLVMRFVDIFWWVEPAYAHQGQWAFWLLDLSAWVGLGGLWVAFFLWQLKRRPLLPPNDPYLPEVLRHE